jgi:hypothetical protein
MAGLVDIAAKAAMISALKRMFLSILFMLGPGTTPGERQ